MKKEELINVVKFIEEETTKTDILHSCWTSGSSTKVYPIMYGHNDALNKSEISVQLNTSNRYWYAKVKSLIAKIKKHFKEYKFETTINKYDGSCPYELWILV